MRVDLNCDMGESFGAYTIGLDSEVIKHITSANVACGMHAGDPLVMAKTVAMAAEHGVGVGAHPGYPDLGGFGRRNMDCSFQEVRDYIIYQTGALMAFCAAAGTKLAHVKPHGALYNTAVVDEEVARGVVEAVASVDPGLILVTLAGSRGETVARLGSERGLKVAREFFPDRAYTNEGTLVNRKLPGAVIHDAGLAMERALLAVSEKAVITVDGARLPIEADTLCVHGDNPEAIELVRSIRAGLEGAGVAVKTMAAPD